MMFFPVIKVRDKTTNRVHIVGTDMHDVLEIEDGQTITYRNLQNGEGTGKYGDYSFVGKGLGQEGVFVEFVTFEQLKEIYLKVCADRERAEQNRKKIVEKVLKDFQS